MQNNKFHYCLHILPILFFMAFVSASCIKSLYLQGKSGSAGSRTIAKVVLDATCR